MSDSKEMAHCEDCNWRGKSGSLVPKSRKNSTLVCPKCGSKNLTYA